MKFSTAITGLLASVATAAESFTSTACIDPKDGFHVISAGGEYTTVGNLSLLNTLATSVLAIAPASQMFQIGYTQNALAPQDITEGLTAFKNHLTDYIQRCPKSKIVTLGYSVGAAIVMDAYCGDPRNPQTYDGYGKTNPEWRSNILANVVYGDLTYVSSQRAAMGRGTCTEGQGVVPRAFPGQCYPFGRKTISFCDVNDPQCCDPNAGSPSVHFSYPGIYDGQATDFVKAKWNYWKRHSKN